MNNDVTVNTENTENTIPRTRMCKCGKPAVFIKDYWVTESKVHKEDTYDESFKRNLESNSGILRRRYCGACISKIAAQQRRVNGELNNKITISVFLPFIIGTILSGVSYFVFKIPHSLVTFIAASVSMVVVMSLLVSYFAKAQGVRKRIESGKYDNLKDIEIMIDSLNFGIQDYKQLKEIPSTDVVVDGDGRVNYEMERSGFYLKVMIEGKVNLEPMRTRIMYPFKDDAEYIKRTYVNAGLLEDNIKSVEAKELTEKDFDVKNGALLRYSGFATEVLIPDNTTKIGFQAFKNSKNCETVIVPPSVTEIEKEAFMGCPATVINIPEGVKEIKSFTFYRSAIREMIIPEGVEKIDDSAFMECFSLEKVVIPSTCKRIGENAFKGCTALTDVVLTEGLEGIGDYAFNSCTALKDIVVPDGCMELGNFSFENCTSLETVALPETIQFVGGRVFDGDTKLSIVGKAGSYAESFAEQQRLRFKLINDGPRYQAPKNTRAKK